MVAKLSENALTLGSGVRSGAEYLAGLDDGRDVWLEGKRVTNVAEHPGLRRGAETLAGFMDKQAEQKYKKIVTFEEDNRDIAMSYLIPKSKEDVVKRGAAFYEWATWSNGIFGRTPDYKNASIMAFSAAAKFLEEGKVEFADNMRRYYHYAATNDKVLTHSLLNPTVNFAEAKAGRSSADVTLKVIKENDAGIFVSGARLLATLGPQADEVEVFPSTLLDRQKDEHLEYAFAFMAPVNSPGLRMICRDSYDHGKSHYDAPLSSRYEEMDAVVTFKNVFVPWERVFIYREPLLCNRAFAETNAVTQMMHQVICGKLVPLRRPLDTSRNLFPKMYPRLIELVQLLGSSSLMATPSELDLTNDIADDVTQYFQLLNLESKDRIALFRMAHDLSVSGFGGRQTLYERFFFGPPNVMASIYYDLYDKDDMIDRVNDLLNQA